MQHSTPSSSSSARPYSPALPQDLGPSASHLNFRSSPSPSLTFPGTIDSIRTGQAGSGSGGSGTYTPTGGLAELHISSAFPMNSGSGDMRSSLADSSYDASNASQSNPHSRTGSFGGSMNSNLLQAFTPSSSTPYQHHQSTPNEYNPPSSHSQLSITHSIPQSHSHSHTLPQAAGSISSVPSSLPMGGGPSAFFDSIPQQHTQPIASRPPTHHSHSILSPGLLSDTGSSSQQFSHSGHSPSGNRPTSRHQKSGCLQRSSTSREKGPRLTKVFARPVESPRSLDDIAPRQTFLSIVALYFCHLYPLLVSRCRSSRKGHCHSSNSNSFLFFLLSNSLAYIEEPSVTTS